MNNFKICYFLSQVVLAVLFWVNAGCVKDHAVFLTSTNFGIDISQQSDQPPTMLVGYRRREGIFLPAEHKNATDYGTDQQGNDLAQAPNSPPTPPQDTYSVLGYFCVMANPSLWDGIKALVPFSENVPDALQINSIFATGFPAQQLAKDPSMREFFQNQLVKTQLKGSEKRCN